MHTHTSMLYNTSNKTFVCWLVACLMSSKTLVYLFLFVCLLGFFFLFTHLYCLVGCLSMIVWTHAVLGVLRACVLYFCICNCSAQLSIFHMESCSRNTLIIIIIIIIIIISWELCITLYVQMYTFQLWLVCCWLVA